MSLAMHSAESYRYLYAFSSLNYGDAPTITLVSQNIAIVENHRFEDFTTFTEVDPNSRITVAADRVTGTNLARNETAYVYKNYGADHFNTNFYHEVAVKCTSSDSGGDFFFYVMSNVAENFKSMVDGGRSGFLCDCYRSGAVYKINLDECDAGVVYQASVTVSVNTQYYVRIIRDESIGTYGTLYIFVYSNSQRTVLVGSGSLALHTSKKDFRYLQTATTYNDGNAAASTVIVSGLDINEDTVTPKTYLEFMMMTAMTMKGALN